MASSKDPNAIGLLRITEMSKKDATDSRSPDQKDVVSWRKRNKMNYTTYIKSSVVSALPQYCVFDSYILAQPLIAAAAFAELLPSVSNKVKQWTCSLTTGQHCRDEEGTDAGSLCRETINNKYSPHCRKKSRLVHLKRTQITHLVVSSFTFTEINGEETVETKHKMLAWILSMSFVSTSVSDCCLGVRNLWLGGKMWLSWLIYSDTTRLMIAVGCSCGWCVRSRLHRLSCVWVSMKLSWAEFLVSSPLHENLRLPLNVPQCSSLRITKSSNRDEYRSL